MAPEERLRNIGEKLREVREKRGETMSVAAVVRNRYGVKLDPSYLSRMERGKAEIPLRTLLALAHYYRVDPAYFIRSDDFPGAEPAAYLLLHPELRQQVQLLCADLGEETLADLVGDFFGTLIKSVHAFDQRSRGPGGAASANLRNAAAALRGAGRDARRRSPRVVGEEDSGPAFAAAREAEEQARPLPPQREIG